MQCGNDGRYQSLRLQTVERCDDACNSRQGKSFDAELLVVKLLKLFNNLSKSCSKIN